MADYLPQADGPFDLWVTNFVNYTNAHLAEFGLVAADMAPINTALIAWNTTYAAVVPAESAFHSAATAKTSARDALETLIRALVKVIQAKGAAVTAASKTAVGVTVPALTATPVAVPVSRPVGRLEIKGVRQHIVHFVDAATPTSKAKPAGARGCQIWAKIGTTPPTSQNELTYLSTDTKTPYTYDFDPPDVGKTAYYWLRWENTTGETGPWSAMVSATITG